MPSPALFGPGVKVISRFETRPWPRFSFWSGAPWLTRHPAALRSAGPVVLKFLADPMQLKYERFNAYQATSRRLSIVVAQHTSKAFSTVDLTRWPANCRLGCDQLIVEALVIAFRMMALI
jgi:hypothetical protein